MMDKEHRAAPDQTKGAMGCCLVNGKNSTESVTTMNKANNCETAQQAEGDSSGMYVTAQRGRLSFSESQVLSCHEELLSEDGELKNNITRPNAYRPKRKSKSLYGAYPDTNFGPKASLLQSQDTTLTIQDPGSQTLTWFKPPLTILIIKKIRDESVDGPFVDLTSWLIKVMQRTVFIEKKVLDDPQITRQLGKLDILNKLSTFQEGVDDLKDKIDLIICLGGDGTLLYAASLFQESVPPVMAFHLGSLGFLSPFDFHDYAERTKQVLDGDKVRLILRTRLKCDIVHEGDTVSSHDAQKRSIRDVESKHHILALNEVVVDRGATPYMCHLDLYIQNKQVTVVQGDGLIISTPTGSTAYAAAAGASMVHPNVPAIIVAPICPHSLSFRPIVVPAGVEIKIKVSPDARDTAWVSFDGRNRRCFDKNDALIISTSRFPLPSICYNDPISDWFDGLAGCLHWNVRKSQHSLSPENPSDAHDPL